MLPKVNTISDLEIQINKKIIFKELLQQINKDFQLIGIDYQFNSNIFFKDFFNQFEQIIKELVDLNFQLFLNLLYRIDLNESKIRAIIATEKESVYARIIFEILKREWQKVWFRHHYK
jgi:hypothetical protein